MPTDRIAAIADRLLQARRLGARIVLDDAPRDFEEGFAVQARVVEGLAVDVAGWKVNPMPDRLALFAPIPASGLVAAGGTWRVAGGQPAGIEVEIAFRMGSDVQVDASPDAVLAAVASAHVVYELCQSRIAEPASQPRYVALADCISNFGLVLGPEIHDWRRKDLRGVLGRLLVDGKPHAEGRSVDPVAALLALPPSLAARGHRLQAGHVVITGSLTGMSWLTGRHALDAEIDGCGRVAIHLDAQ